MARERERKGAAYRVHFAQLAQDACPKKYAIIISLASFAFCGHSRATPTAISVSATSHSTGETFVATVPETNTHITVTRLARDVDDVTRHGNNEQLWFLHGMQMVRGATGARGTRGGNKNSV